MGKPCANSKNPFSFIKGQLGDVFQAGDTAFTVVFWSRFIRLEEFGGAWRLLGERLESAWRDFAGVSAHSGGAKSKFKSGNIVGNMLETAIFKFKEKLAPVWRV